MTRFESGGVHVKATKSKPKLSGVLAWENPPASDLLHPDEKPIDHELVAGTLREFPQHWGLIAVGGPSLYRLVHAISKGKISHYRPEGSFEVEARQTPSMYRLYARYIGVPTQSDPPTKAQRSDRQALSQTRCFGCDDDIWPGETIWSAPGDDSTFLCQTCHLLND